MGFKNFHSCETPSYVKGMDDSVVWECNGCGKKYQAEVDIHWSHVTWREIESDNSVFETSSSDSDLNKFISLYEGFGINLDVEVMNDESYIRLTVGDFGNKVIGYNYHYTEVKFDKNGKFIKQIIRD